MRTRNICDIYFITHSLLPLSDCLPHFLLSALHFSSLYPLPHEGHQTGSVHHRSRGIRLAVYNPHPFRDIRLAVYNPHPFTDIRLAVCNPSPFRGIRLPVYMPPSGTSGCQFIPSNPFRGIRGWQFVHPTPLQAHQAGSLNILLPFRIIRLVVFIIHPLHEHQDGRFVPYFRGIRLAIPHQLAQPPLRPSVDCRLWRPSSLTP